MIGCSSEHYESSCPLQFFCHGHPPGSVFFEQLCDRAITLRYTKKHEVTQRKKIKNGNVN